MDNPTEVVGAGSMVLFMLLSFLAGGGSVLIAVGMLARMVLNSPVLIKNLEHLANSASPDLIASLNSTGTLLVEATDNIPAALKPTAPGTTTTEVTTTSTTVSEPIVSISDARG